MKTPKKAVVSKRVTDEIIANSNRWTQFIIHSGIRFEDLSDEWVLFFDQQAEISTAQTGLVVKNGLVVEIYMKKNLWV